MTSGNIVRATRRRAFLADTTALVLFFTATGILNERFVAGMDWSEVVTARAIGAPLMVLTARPYGLWRDIVMRRAGPGWRSRLGWDTVALLSFQVPIYAAILAMGGAEGNELLRGTLGAACLMIALGRPYGMFLDAFAARSDFRRGDRSRCPSIRRTDRDRPAGHDAHLAKVRGARRSAPSACRRNPAGSHRLRALERVQEKWSRFSARNARKKENLGRGR